MSRPKIYNTQEGDGEDIWNDPDLVPPPVVEEVDDHQSY